MGMFKEEMKALIELADKQKRIYSDAADVGVIATPKVKDQMREILRTLLPLPGSEVVWHDKTLGWEQVSYNLRVYWSQFNYTDTSVLYFNDLAKDKEFFSIDFTQGNEFQNRRGLEKPFYIEDEVDSKQLNMFK